MNGLAVTLALIAVAMRVDADGNPEIYSTATGIFFGLALTCGVVGAVREFRARN